MAQDNLRFGFKALALAVATASGSATAATYTVTSLAPSGDGTLTQAIALANLNPGTDTIQFSVTGTIELDAGGLPRIEDALIVQGPGAAALDIRGGSTGFPMFEVYLQEGDVSISDISVSEVPEGAFDAYGNAGSLIVKRVQVSGSTTNRALFNVYEGADLSLSDSVIADNVMNEGDAPISVSSATATISGSTIARNSLSGSAGGLYADYSTVTVSDTDFSDNTNSGGTTDGSAGAVYATQSTLTVEHSRFTGNEGHAGGAIAVADTALEIDGSSFSGNTARTYGGALRATGTNTAVTITGSSFRQNAVGDDQVSGGGAVSMTGGATASLSVIDSLIEDNETAGQGGGLAIDSVGTVTLSRVDVSGNSANQGGGLLLSGAGAYELAQSSIDGNTATEDGAGILFSDAGTEASLTISESSVSDNASGYRPAVVMEMDAISPASTIVISRSTFAGNTGTDHGAIEIGRFDGLDGLYSYGSVSVVNSTFSGNTATSADTGILFGPHASFTVEHSTFVDNAGDAVSGVQVHAATKTNESGLVPEFDLSRSVFTSGNPSEIRFGDSPYGAGPSSHLLTVSGDDNIAVQGEEVKPGASNDTSAATDDPILGALADNGGFTLTHLPQAGSAAIDAAPDGNRPDSVDQRGVAADGDADLGAVEAIDNRAPELVGNFETSLSGWVGRGVDVLVAAQFSDPDGDDVVVEAVDGLPEGVTFDVGTGRITGSPTRAGSYNVTIQVRDDAAQPLSRVVRVTAVVAEKSTVVVRKSSSGGAASGLLLAMAGLLLGWRRKR